jgi:hypothetical protein
MRFRFLSILLITFFLVADVSTQAAKAQSGSTEDAKTSEFQDSENIDSSLYADGYVPSSWKNLSKLYWAMGVFSFDDVQAIDSFTMINECDLYKKYNRDDFMLQDIRNVMRESIKANLANYPTKLEVVLRIGLDRYDLGTERFMLSAATQFIGTKRFEFAGPIFSEYCGSRTLLHTYPNSFILNLRQPFNLKSILVHPDLAQAYIDSRATVKFKSNADAALSPLLRVAYLRLKVSVHQYKETAFDSRNAPVYAFVGSVDGFEVYGDEERTMLLYNESVEQSIQERRRSERDKDKMFNLGDGPLLKPSEPEVNEAQ